MGTNFCVSVSQRSSTVLNDASGSSPHILGEHGEEAAHEEHRHVLGRVSDLQRLRHGGEALRDGAGDARRMPGGIEGERLGPDRPQPVADLRLAQVVEEDAEAAAVRELVVDLPVAAEVRVDLETVADVADDEEGRRLVADGQQRHIGLGLLARVDHQHVPSPVGAAPALVGLRQGRQGQLPDDLVAGAPEPRLLGFEDEAAAPVEVDARGGDGAVPVRLLDGAFEDVVVAIRTGARRLRPRQIEHVAEFDQEKPVIGPLLPSFAALPAVDEGVDRVGGCGSIGMSHDRRLVAGTAASKERSALFLTRLRATGFTHLGFRDAGRSPLPCGEG